MLKVGRTQLQDAVPMTLGQEFTRLRAHPRTRTTTASARSIPWLNEINMGATAIGTGITADPRYAEAVRRHLEELTGIAHGDRARPDRGDRDAGHLHDPDAAR